MRILNVNTGQRVRGRAPTSTDARTRRSRALRAFLIYFVKLGTYCIRMRSHMHYNRHKIIRMRVIRKKIRMTSMSAKSPRDCGRKRVEDVYS